MDPFSVSCGISNISIEDWARTGFVFLMPNSYRTLEFGKFFSNINDLYIPYAPPVFGICSDYERIDDIIPSATTQYLEDNLNQPIEILIRCVNNYGRNIYDMYGPIAEYFSNNLPDSQDLSFKNLGFEVISDDKFQIHNWVINLIRHENNSVTHWKLQTVHSSSTFTKFRVSMDFKENLETFSHITGVVPGFDKKDWESILLLRQMHGMYFHGKVFSEMMKRSDEYLQGRDSYNVDTLIKSVESLNQSDSVTPLDFEAHKNSSQVVDYWAKNLCSTVTHFVLNSDLDVSKDLNNILSLNKIMSAVNHMYIPTYCADQYGNIQAADVLAQTVERITAAEQITAAELEDMYS